MQIPNIESWKKKLETMRATHGGLVDKHVQEEKNRVRQEVRPKIQELFSDFLAGTVDLKSLRSTFDAEARTSWESFGLKGPSGGMFLNKLVKNLPRQVKDVEGWLREVLKQPRSDTDARVRMQEFHDRLVGLIEQGVAPSKDVQPSRVPVFVSAAWHMSDPEAWPIYYTSMRRSLIREELWKATDNPVESYFLFVEAVRALKQALGLGMWEFEYLCSWDEENANEAFVDSIEAEAAIATHITTPPPPEPVSAIAASGITPEATAPYTLDTAASELFLPRVDIESLRELLLHRQNVVLQGPPGAGKTFLASRLAALLTGQRDSKRVRFVQFHQAYSYEDFVQGYRPVEGGGFARRDGPLLRICEEARHNIDDKYVLLIDEINRGNLSKILGESMMLVEPDKRDKRWAISLTYSKEDEAPFYIPPNLYIIGTMNTADRSLALVDYALRRRFAFVDVTPAIDEPTFQKHLLQLGAPPRLIERIRDRVRQVNTLIADDESLGKGFLVGHSYFTQKPGNGVLDDAWYERIVEYELEPLLREYWFDRPDKAVKAAELLLADD
jgi:hypothetical protein